MLIITWDFQKRNQFLLEIEKEIDIKIKVQCKMFIVFIIKSLLYQCKRLLINSLVNTIKKLFSWQIEK